MKQRTMDEHRRKYTLYVDETGTHGITPKALEHDRHFCLFGAIIPRIQYKSVMVPEFEAIKEQIFGPGAAKTVVLHQREIDERSGPFTVFNDRAIRHRYNTLMVDFLRRHECRYIAIALDKKAHVESHGAHAWNPYSYTAKLLFERFCLFLHSRRAEGRVRAESRSDVENAILHLQYMRYRQYGTQYVAKEAFKEHLRHAMDFHPKADNVVGLQIADVLANMALEGMLIERGKKKSIRNHSRLHYLEAIQDKWDRNSLSGDVWGYGKVFLPKNTKAAVVDSGSRVTAP